MIDPADLAKHYTRFRVTERILLTGHSHQAWPDVAFDAQQQAWLDTAEHVDDVWDLAFQKANEVRRGFARLLDDTPERIALAQNTHELVVRFLSALPLRKRPQLVTTDGEFHTIRRQLDRLAEEGIEVIKVPAMPASTLAGAHAFTRLLDRGEVRDDVRILIEHRRHQHRCGAIVDRDRQALGQGRCRHRRDLDHLDALFRKAIELAPDGVKF
ncbi:MAG TPA: hypothetical protein VEZ51_08995, partial [Gemmatimonadaceae bacterium]|nr:hypothetical protein [Gemmatimonadaceae bacterium]